MLEREVLLLMFSTREPQSSTNQHQDQPTLQLQLPMFQLKKTFCSSHKTFHSQIPNSSIELRRQKNSLKNAIDLPQISLSISYSQNVTDNFYNQTIDFYLFFKLFIPNKLPINAIFVVISKLKLSSQQKCLKKEFENFFAKMGTFREPFKI